MKKKMGKWGNKIHIFHYNFLKNWNILIPFFSSDPLISLRCVDKSISKTWYLFS